VKWIGFGLPAVMLLLYLFSQAKTMSIYDQRDKPAYGQNEPNPSYCVNPHILKWWSSTHDQLLPIAIREKQWIWAATITNKIVAITPNNVIENWKRDDPLCSKYAWYNVLMNFAASRAAKLGFINEIRKPTWKTCPLCNERFVEDSLPIPFIERLGLDHLDFCAPCLTSRIFRGASNDSASREEVLIYLRDLANQLKQVPSQDFGSGMYDLLDMSTDERIAVFSLLEQKPTLRRVKELFGSWFKALIEAGVIEDGARRISLGTQCLAKDGHMCFSLGEKTIDDMLHALGIQHEREPMYPEGNYRADFLVNGIFIEYFGLAGDPEYDKKSAHKKKLCEKHGVRLIAIKPQDLTSSKRLESFLSTALGL
jgi:hypothetical protein